LRNSGEFLVKNESTNFSVVVPVYNEVGVLPELYRRLTTVMLGMGEPYEIMFVDDGSTDDSIQIIRDLNSKDPAIKCLSLSRNFGHQTAISAGMAHASGKAIIVMDGDLQDPPEVIPQLVEKWKGGYDVVYAVRKKRKENLLMRTAYAAFYRVLKYLSDIEVPLDSGDFAVMDRKVVNLLASMRERNRFVRGLRSWVGFKQIGIPYEREKRYSGRPKYDVSRLVRLALDGFVTFSRKPLQLASILGLAFSGVAFTLGFYFVILKLTIGIPVPGWTSLVVIILFLGGIQLFAIGVVGEYISRIYDEVRQRPLCVVSDYIGIKPPQESGGLSKGSSA
jgi:dolichol-phosphate mannosyltransferase